MCRRAASRVRWLDRIIVCAGSVIRTSLSSFPGDAKQDAIVVGPVRSIHIPVTTVSIRACSSLSAKMPSSRAPSRPCDTRGRSGKRRVLARGVAEDNSIAAVRTENCVLREREEEHATRSPVGELQDVWNHCMVLLKIAKHMLY